MTIFMKGLLPGICPAVMSKHESQPFRTLNELLSASQHAENSNREATKRPTGVVFIPTPTSDRTRRPGLRPRPTNKNTAINAVDPDTSVAQTNHSATDSEIADEMAEMGTATAYQYPTVTTPSSTDVPEAVNATVPHPGQSSLPPEARPSTAEQPGWPIKLKPPPPEVAVCYSCFGEGHVARDCPITRKYEAKEISPEYLMIILDRNWEKRKPQYRQYYMSIGRSPSKRTFSRIAPAYATEATPEGGVSESTIDPNAATTRVDKPDPVSYFH